MEVAFMRAYPQHYMTIVREIENYDGASLHTDQIIRRVFYRLENLKGVSLPELTTGFIIRLTKRSAYEILNTKTQLAVLTDDELLEQHADNVRQFDDKLADNELLQDIIRLTTDKDESYIISAWATGCSDTEIARTLTSLHGGTLESQRSKVKRYRTKLRNNKVIKSMFAA